MKILKLALLVALVLIVWDWINSCGTYLAFSDLLPFSNRWNHSFDYNYLAILMIGLTIWGIRRLYGRRRI